MRFDEHYSERVQLPDSAWVTLRLVRPSDKELVRRAFEHLSNASRYSRFMSVKVRLTEAELKYLTEVDGFNHFAIVATHACADGTEEGVGIARFVRLLDEATVAEAAVTVVDDWQGRRLGTLLLERLAAAARERDIQHFRAFVLPNNPRIRALLQELGAATTVKRDGTQLTVDISLQAAAERATHVSDEPLKRMLRAVAQSSSSDEQSDTR